MKKIFKAFSYPATVWFPKTEHNFLIFICCAFLLAMFATPFPQYAMWVGFLFAAYAAIANDSIQTIGTFIASNQDKKWWVLWIFIGGIFCATMSYSWFYEDKTGITIFSNKINSDNIDENDRNLNFYANYGIKLETGEIEKGSSIKIEKISNSKIKWSVVSLDKKPKILKSGFLEYNTKYRNDDYGLCFYINNYGEICEVINISKESDDDPTIKNTFYKYKEIYYKKQDGLSDSKLVSYDEDGKRNMSIELYADGIRDKDVSHARLAAKGFEQTPRNFHFLQVAAAIFLLILTRLRMPVSTTFILLTSFAATTSAVGKVLAKSMSGYILAFVLGLIFFFIVAKSAKKYFVGKAHPGWTIAQWITSGSLWAVWLSQDAANIAVYLPRSVNQYQFIGFLTVVTIGLGLLLYYKGGRIQKIVTEKSVVTDVRFATLIDLIYCIILFYFKLHSNVPMSTTWVFIGLLAGRELGMSLMKTGSHTILSGMKLALKDVTFALIGLFVSIAIAVGVNDSLSFSNVITEIPPAFIDGITSFFTKLAGGG